MNKKELDFIIKQGEGQHIEFKESFDKSLVKEIIAFANAQGGRIYLGINDKGLIKEINITNSLKSQIQDIAKNCDPSILVNLSAYKNILIVNVHEGNDKPYSCSSGFYLRMGANTQKLTRDEIMQFAISEGKKLFDEQICDDFVFLDDFDEDKLKSYLKEAKIESELDNKSILLNLGVAKLINKQFKFTNAGILFFAKKPSKYFMTTKVVCAEYATNEKVKILDRKIYDEGILKNLKNAINFISKRIKIEFEIKSAKRKEIPQFPEEAFREAVVNAIMHRDYFDKTSEIMIECYRNKIVVYNPGGLVKWLRPEEFGKISKLRNPLIASLLSRTIYAEKMGTGIKRMNKAMIKAGLKEPAYEYYDTSFYTQFDDKNIEKRKGKSSVKSSVKSTVKSSVKILNLIKKDAYITIPEIAKTLNLTTRAIEKQIANLKKTGKIKRIGPDKGGYWEEL
ncbi:MAG: RNA-binding domain-containing protein [Pseudomonadota bacterium]